MSKQKNDEGAMTDGQLIGFLIAAMGMAVLTIAICGMAYADTSAWWAGLGLAMLIVGFASWDLCERWGGRRSGIRAGSRKS